ncbi:YeeE/YedE family protein [Ensifer adhaerens]|uniref:YeeE/YedE family protein n=1 Tax=Ensifer adhaerens TaxID=106592 RepID=UPI001C4DFFF3|nr:YeeE/YedE family protein [Ensifer adhaerens]MBW0368044.1 YeeE/YedE family protein [Ensifer adhaerens]UCM23700.1 YeeE/YedE family protein [Ensifer adhaerens]
MFAKVASAIVCGLLFGAGLVVSDMINPARVRAFLDVFGNWDPSLAFVMGGALIPSTLAYVVRNRWQAPLFDDQFHVPPKTGPDARLVAGAVLFGVGWGMVGLCPGPAIAALTTGRWQAGLFVGAMLTGMIVYRFAFARMALASR